MEDHRSSGILLAVSSARPLRHRLPGRTRPAVRGFSRRGRAALLADPAPCPTGDGSSPYMSPSAFAGNPYLIDLDELAAEGLLTPRSWTGPAGPTRTGWITTIWPRPVSPCCGRPGNAPKPPTSSLTPQTCPGWRITAPSPPSTTGIKPLSGSGLRTPLRRSRRRLIFTVSSRRPSTASGWL